MYQDRRSLDCCRCSKVTDTPLAESTSFNWSRLSNQGLGASEFVSASAKANEHAHQHVEEEPNDDVRAAVAVEMIRMPGLRPLAGSLCYLILGQLCAQGGDCTGLGDMAPRSEMVSPLRINFPAWYSK